MALLVLLLLAITQVFASEELVHFYGHKVVRTNLTSVEQVAAVEALNLDVWSHDCVLDVGENDLMLTDETLPILRKLGIPYHTLIDDVEARIQAERDFHSNLTAPMAFFDAYRTYDEILQYMRDLVASFPTLVSMAANIGSSVQGRAIPALVITAGSASGKRKIFLSGGQHAREWVGPTTTLYVAEQLITRYSTDTVVRNLLTNGIFYVVPLMNPDGYVFTWTSNRLWRKNRRLNTGGSYGVDLNRNWDDHFGGSGSSGTPTSDTYRGPFAFSEPETTAVSRYCATNGPYVGAIDWHSYSQLVLRPYGWGTSAPPNEAAAKAVGDAISANIRAYSGYAYTSQRAYQLYLASGIASDWYNSKGGAPLAYTIELRDTGQYGFQLPPAQIIPTGNENWAAFREFARTTIGV